MENEILPHSEKQPLVEHDPPEADSSQGISTPETIGHRIKEDISVEISTRFLEHFSESLYSSPQKAFEELVSNSWDAGADRVDIRISENLNRKNATMCVLDNGASMDIEGLKLLWKLAFSTKKDTPELYGRPVIGKFGIGKLATYVLAGKLTYICKADDGLIRRVTMDYSWAIPDDGEQQERLMSEVKLPLYEVDENQVKDALQHVDGGAKLLEVIARSFPKPDGFPEPDEELTEGEFRAPKAELERPSENTWTLVILSALKPIGRSLKIGFLRRMLQAALPIGSEMAIIMNDELLSSSKLDLEKEKEWTIGPDLEISCIEIDENDDEEDENAQLGGDDPSNTHGSRLTKIPVTASDSPWPHIEIPGIGRVTGQVQLFRDRISGGKSDERGASNGFHVNVLGRVINQQDISFGQANLSHAAWARFRMTVRADGLNDHLTTNREQLTECREVVVFRAFLRKVFNKARQQYDSDGGLPDGGDVLVRSLGIISLKPLRNIVAETLKSQSPLPDLFDESGLNDREGMNRTWQQETSENIGSALGAICYEQVDDGSFVKYRLKDRSMVVNRNHPFVAEHSRTRAEKELLRTIAMVNFLTDIYVLDLGIEPEILQNIRSYRDRLLQFKALQKRKSGIHIAKLLRQVQHDSANSRKFEAVLSDALRYLGFEVKDMAKPGEPEGVASAYTYPTKQPTDPEEQPPLYKFTFDAKSSKHDAAKTGNIDLAAITEHRDKYRADYALVVAPGFSGDAIGSRCESSQVTPMTAADLGMLLEYTVRYGAIDLVTFREIFERFRPDQVHDWVQKLGDRLTENRILTLDVFLKSLEHMKGDVPDAISAGMFVYICKTELRKIITDTDVLALAKGLAILTPDLIGVENDKIIVNASVQRVAAAIERQLETLHNDEQSDGSASIGIEE